MGMETNKEDEKSKCRIAQKQERKGESLAIGGMTQDTAKKVWG